MRDFLGFVALLFSAIPPMLAVQWILIAIGSYDPARDDGVSTDRLPFLWAYQAVLFIAGAVAMPFAWRWLNTANDRT